MKGKVITKSGLLIVFLLCYLLFQVMTVQASDESEKPEQSYSVEFTCNTQLGCSQLDGCCINASVGGVVVSVNKFDLIAPYFGLGLAIITPAIAIGTAKYIKRRKTQQ